MINMHDLLETGQNLDRLNNENQAANDKVGSWGTRWEVGEKGEKLRNKVGS